jgi:hypothetical protein
VLGWRYLLIFSLNARYRIIKTLTELEWYVTAADYTYFYPVVNNLVMFF